MTAPRFRSTAGLSAQRRVATPTIDRATFVIFGVGAERYAVAVERVERVLRRTTGSTAPESIAYGGQPIRLVALHEVLGGAHAAGPNRSSHAATADAADRVLIFLVEDCWVAAVVDTVFEVATIDAALVESVKAEREAEAAGSARHCPPGARGYFQRHGHDVVVLDVTRVMRMVYASAAHTSAAHAVAAADASPATAAADAVRQGV